MKEFCRNLLKKHPLGVLYAALLGLVAFFAAVPMLTSGTWDAALVDLLMAGIMIYFMLKSFIAVSRRESFFAEKCVAWLMLAVANILALLPTGSFPGSLTAALAFTLLICAFVLYFSGTFTALASVVPALWCCVFMPYHEEFMLLLSFPLRLSATLLSAGVLKLCGIGVVYSGTSLELPGLNISITDACSGINQLDAFILIAFVIVHILHKKKIWQILHFAFIIPSIIIGNGLRIALTVLLYKLWGETVLANSWHTALGYVQIVLALILFLIAGKIFSFSGTPDEEVEK